MDSKKYYTTLHEPKLFQDFLYLNFKDYKDYKKMKPVSNCPARLYASVKTHKFVDQTINYTYNAAQVISNYLKLCALMNIILKMLYNFLDF